MSEQFYFCMEHEGEEVALVVMDAKVLENPAGFSAIFECPKCKRKIKYHITMDAVQKIFGTSGKPTYTI